MRYNGLTGYIKILHPQKVFIVDVREAGGSCIPCGYSLLRS